MHPAQRRDAAAATVLGGFPATRTRTITPRRERLEKDIFYLEQSGLPTIFSISVCYGHIYAIK